jgi:hypothetical protein
MKVSIHAGWASACRVTIAFWLFLLLAACTPMRSLAALAWSTDHFVPFVDDERVRVEPGADRFALMLSPYMTEAVTTVEASQAGPFKSPVRVYLCASDTSFSRLTGRRAPATTTNDVYLSPDLFDGTRALDRYLTHELSHLHLVQNIGVLGGTRLPEWFKEGLAEMVSGGATSSSVAVSEALKAVGEGRSFMPDEGRNVVASFLFPHYGTYWHIENRMFYRQSMLFVQFMRDQDPAAFRRFLAAVVQGDDFKKALHRTYPDGVRGLWAKFVDEARASGSRAT